MDYSAILIDALSLFENDDNIQITNSE